MAVTKEFSSFESLITTSDQPILVDFYADWCGPCQLMARILEEVHATLKSRLRIIKINTEKYPDLASRYQVYALPTLLLFHQGKPIDRIEGVVSAPELIQHLQRQILNP